MALLLCLACVSSANAYKAGTNAVDTPSSFPQYANVAAFLADPNRHIHKNVRIGTRDYDGAALRRFPGLTDANLIQTYTNAAAYLADSGRSDRLYAEINGRRYVVSVLEAVNRATPLSDSNLPSPVELLNGNTAVGDSAQATGDGATAVGNSAEAAGDLSTAMGQYSSAAGRATAVGWGARAYGDRSTALGKQAYASGSRATSAGSLSVADGLGAVSIGGIATALGNRNVAVGRSATTAALSRWQNIWDIVPPGQTFTQLVECARDPDMWKDAGRFIGRCDGFMTNAERSSAMLARQDAQGETFRGSIRTRLTQRLGELSVQRSTAVGYYAHALADRTTALGDSARATAYSATAVGRYAHAFGDRSVALGSAAAASGTGSIALGRATIATAAESTAIGRSSGATGEHTLAVGQSAGAGAWRTVGRYDSVADYLADDNRLAFGRRYTVIGDKVYSIPALEAVSSLTDASLPPALADASEIIAPRRYYVRIGEYLADDFARANYRQVLIGGNAYNVADLEAVVNDPNRELQGSTLPTPLKGASGAVAVGVGAHATAENAIAFGLDAHATGTRSIAIGADAAATAAGEVVIGTPAHHYRLPGLAVSQDATLGLVTVDRSGRLARGGPLEAGLGSDTTASIRLSALETGLGTTADAASDAGSAYARLAALKQGQESAISRVGTLETSVGAPADMASSTGSVHARIKDLNQLQAATGGRLTTINNLIDEATSDERAIMNALDRTRELDVRADGDGDGQADGNDGAAVQKIYEAPASRVTTTRIQLGSGDEQVMLTLTGRTNEQIVTLLALLTNRAAPGEVLRDVDGNPIGSTTKEFQALDDPGNRGGKNEPAPVPVGSENRLGYLFEALYGDPSDGVVNNPATDSENPGPKSAFGRIGSLEEGRLPTALQKAEGVGTGADAPATAADRRVVVQDTNTNGSVRLRTLDIDPSGLDRRVAALDQRVGTLSEYLDRRVGTLSERLDRTAAMTSALTSLPNVVPSGGRFYLGAGVGHYRGEQALAVGMSARLGPERNVFLNAGFAAAASGGPMSARAGMGVVW